MEILEVLYHYSHGEPDIQFVFSVDEMREDTDYLMHVLNLLTDVNVRIIQMFATEGGKAYELTKKLSEKVLKVETPSKN